MPFEIVIDDTGSYNLSLEKLQLKNRDPDSSREISQLSLIIDYTASTVDPLYKVFDKLRDINLVQNLSIRHSGLNVIFGAIDVATNVRIGNQVVLSLSMSNCIMYEIADHLKHNKHLTSFALEDIHINGETAATLERTANTQWYYFLEALTNNTTLQKFEFCYSGSSDNDKKILKDLVTSNNVLKEIVFTGGANINYDANLAKAFNQNTHITRFTADPPSYFSIVDNRGCYDEIQDCVTRNITITKYRNHLKGLTITSETDRNTINRFISTLNKMPLDLSQFNKSEILLIANTHEELIKTNRYSQKECSHLSSVQDKIQEKVPDFSFNYSASKKGIVKMMQDFLAPPKTTPTMATLSRVSEVSTILCK
jgi:hypothetical protein